MDKLKQLIDTWQSAVEDAAGDELKIAEAKAEYGRRLVELRDGTGSGGPVELDVLKRAQDACGRGDEASTWAALQAVLPPAPKQPPLAVDLGQAGKDPVPERLIGLAGAGGRLLSAGEVMLLSGAGGVGKSTLVSQIAAVAACTSGGSVAGLSVEAGGVYIVCFEDSRWQVFQRTNLIADHLGLPDETKDRMNWPMTPAIPAKISVNGAAGWPLFGVDDGGHIGQAPQKLEAMWRPLWDDIAKRRPRYVVIDPATSAFNGDDSRVSAVRAFLDALREEAERVGAGIILVAHSTKAARLNDDDIGAVAGSAAWTDAARSALVLKRERDDEGGAANAWRLKSVKANYSPPVDVSLTAQYAHDGQMVGFELTDYNASQSAMPNGKGALHDREYPGD